MRIKLINIFVDNQDKALRFYTEVLGFDKKQDLPAGTFKWLTLVSPEEPESPELPLESNDDPATAMNKKVFYAQGIAAVAFAVDDMRGECKRLHALGVAFHTGPAEVGSTTNTVLDDTCGNLAQVLQI